MRRKRNVKRDIAPDYKYNNTLVAKFINYLMEDGKKSIRKEKLESVNIYYTYDDNGILKFGTLTYLTD